MGEPIVDRPIALDAYIGSECPGSPRKENDFPLTPLSGIQVHDVAVDTAVMSMGLSNLELDTLALTLDEGMGGERIVSMSP